MNKTRADLFESYAKILRMVQGTGMDALRGFKIANAYQHDFAFYGRVEDYTFAIGIVANIFVFEGDVLYLFNGQPIIAQPCNVSEVKLSWTKPQTPRELHLEAMKAAFNRGEVVECLPRISPNWVTLACCEQIRDDGCEYRIKPEGKPDVVIELNVHSHGDVVYLSEAKPNIEITFTADGVLKGVKLL